MRVASFKHGGIDSYGVVVGHGEETTILDLGAIARDRWATLKAVLSADALNDVKELAETKLPELALDDIEFLLPIPAPEKIFCVGRNYKGHVAVIKAKKPLEHPSIFVRVTSSFASHGRPIEKPRASNELDFEGELAVVVGKRGRNIPESEAHDHIAGYTVLNEGSVRDWQKRGAQNSPGKNFYHSGSMGPWITSADEIPNPDALTITTRLNGTVMQKGRTGSMIYGIPFLVSYISKITWLEPGDIIATGSPEGAGASRNPPVWMKGGDSLEVEISQVGTLQNPVEEEPAT
jgi:2-keto-4-pentenoate hydratase/2-oxohepta-3-ene-1,7-dioic acid hydratase in catechol pathway